jgi:Ser/Thr protein kinase RdoA (MazF antagonist)
MIKYQGFITLFNNRLLEVFMNNTYFPVRYSQLSPDALKVELLKRYNLSENISCRLFDSGLNDIYIIKTSEETFYLRITQAGKYDKIDYEEEVFIINTLCENSISAAAPVRCLDDSFVWEINAVEGIRFAVLFKEAINKPSEDNVKKMYNLGRMLAKIHVISDEKRFKVSRAPIDLMQLAYNPLEKIKPYLAHRKADYEFLKEATNKLSKFVEQIGYDKPYYGYCHGDIHSGNVFFNGDEPVVFDFDCMGYGWRAYDICVYAWNETAGDESYIEKEPWKAFIEGYNSVRQLNELELLAIPAFTALRDLWLMGLHADVIEKNAGCCWYNDGYFDYRIKIFKLWYERVYPMNNLG